MVGERVAERALGRRGAAPRPQRLWQERVGDAGRSVVTGPPGSAAGGEADAGVLGRWAAEPSPGARRLNGQLAERLVGVRPRRSAARDQPRQATPTRRAHARGRSRRRRRRAGPARGRRRQAEGGGIWAARRQHDKATHRDPRTRGAPVAATPWFSSEANAAASAAPQSSGRWPRAWHAASTILAAPWGTLKSSGTVVCRSSRSRKSAGSTDVLTSSTYHPDRRSPTR